MVEFPSFQIGCSKKRWKCVGYETLNDDEAVLIGSLSLDKLVTQSPGRSTVLKLEWPYHGAGIGINATDSYEGIDRCCPASNVTDWANFVRRHLLTKGITLLF